MQVKRYVKTSIFYFVLAIALAAIVASVVALAVKNNQINKLSDKADQLTQTEQKLEDAQKEIEKSKSEKEKLQKKLDAEKDKNKKLQNENEAYKKEIENLSAKKKAAVYKKLAKKNISQPKTPSGEKICYLTFDDGPSVNTPRILKILKKYNAKATFFVIGTNSRLEYLKDIHKAGHAIGVHSNSHVYSKIYSSTANFFNDFNKISNKIEKQIGIKPKIMRFPGGSNNTVSRNYRRGIMTDLTLQIQAKGYAYFDWNVDSEDASGNNIPANHIKSCVLKQAKGRNSICVLMHDTGAKGTTVTALPGIIEGLKKQGYKFGVLTEKTYGYHFRVNN